MAGAESCENGFGCQAWESWKSRTPPQAGRSTIRTIRRPGLSIAATAEHQHLRGAVGSVDGDRHVGAGANMP